jgi:exo-beta-1,3-glucanase (GH17 family)
MLTGRNRIGQTQTTPTSPAKHHGKICTAVQGLVFTVAVGSEALYKGSFSGPGLVENIKDIKSGLATGFEVGIAGSWNICKGRTTDALISGMNVFSL